MTSPSRETVLAKIKSQGHWRVKFHPTHRPVDDLELLQAKSLLFSGAIDLTGWDYPHVPTVDNERQQRLRSVGNNFVEGVTDFQNYKEILRFYRSSLFYHLMAFWEDWIVEDSWLPPNHYAKQIPPGSVLDFLSVNQIVTEIFMFLQNLVESGRYADGVMVTLELRGVRGRHLTTLNPTRMPLRDEYVCLAENLTYGPAKYSAEAIRESYLEVAAAKILEIYRAFNWDGILADGVKDNQRALLRSRR